MTQPIPVKKRPDAAAQPQADVNVPKESVAGEEDPGAALDDGEPCENDPALRPVPATPKR